MATPLGSYDLPRPAGDPFPNVPAGTDRDRGLSRQLMISFEHEGADVNRYA
jgi:hypothetical protein